MARVKRGKIIEVENKNKKFGANSEYYALWVENSKGSEYCLLFTEYELNRAKERAAKTLKISLLKDFSQIFLTDVRIQMSTFKSCGWRYNRRSD